MISLLCIIILLVGTIGIFAANILIGSGSPGQSASIRLTLASIPLYASKEMLSTMNSNDKPNTVLLWDKDIPRYDINNTEILEDCKKNIKLYVPSFFRSGINRVLESNFQMKPKMEIHSLETGSKNPAMIIIPGGAYLVRSEKDEGTDIAEWLNNNGISAFVLNYRLAPYGYPVALEDAERAIRYLRYHASEYKIDPDRIGVIGFSAGGHVVSMLGTHFTSGDPDAQEPIEKMSSRPDLMVLGYPVTVMRENKNSFLNTVLLGKTPSKEMLDLISNEKHVTSNTPPTFFWQTAVDKLIPVETSKIFTDALKANNVPCELYIFPNGPHGLGLAKNQEGAKEWPDLCIKWLKAQGF